MIINCHKYISKTVTKGRPLRQIKDEWNWELFQYSRQNLATIPNRIHKKPSSLLIFSPHFLGFKYKYKNEYLSRSCSMWFCNHILQNIVNVLVCSSDFFNFFNCYLAAPRPTLVHYRGGSLTHAMLITALFTFDPKVTRSLVTRLGS